MSDDLVKRLRAPAYWFSESDEGHPGENSAPREAADRIEALETEVEFTKDALELERALSYGAHRRARGAAADGDAWKANAERLAEALQHCLDDMDGNSYDNWWTAARAAIAAHNKQKDGEA